MHLEGQRKFVAPPLDITHNTYRRHEERGLLEQFEDNVPKDGDASTMYAMRSCKTS
jgi:hypothetical protein